jgi:hypothetical protein
MAADGVRVPDGLLTAATGITAAPNTAASVSTGRKYAALVLDLQVTGTSVTFTVEHQRVADGVWCTFATGATLLTAPGTQSISIPNPVGSYRLNVTAVSGALIAGYSCGSPSH